MTGSQVNLERTNNLRTQTTSTIIQQLLNFPRSLTMSLALKVPEITVKCQLTVIGPWLAHAQNTQVGLRA